MAAPPHNPPQGITFLAGLDRDLRIGLATEIRALWTHHSTALEGNSLSLGDTAFVLQEGLTVSGKPLKDHQEVVGHARAIDLLYGMVDTRKQVLTADLHQLHRAVQTEVAIDCFMPVGTWKVEPNGAMAILSNGTTRWHDYANPGQVPTLMEMWCGVLNQACATPSTGASVVAAYTDLHLGFTLIHPYADGNGRMARLLANLPIIMAGEPPILVPQDRRRDYLMLLGDCSAAGGGLNANEPLVPRHAQWGRLSGFFQEVSQSSRDLTAAYRKRQAERKRSHTNSI